MNYHFDQSKADRVKHFITTFCRQTKSVWGSKPLTLIKWQEELIDQLFGTLDENNLRRYRQCGIWISRRNGKTTIVASIGLFMLMADGEPGAEVYICSNTIQQSKNCFEAICGMIEQSRSLSQRLRINKTDKAIYYDKTRSKLRILSSTVSGNLGANASTLIFDEIGFFQDRRLYTFLRSSMLNRQQPLILTISTASDNLTGIGREQYELAKGIKENLITDVEDFLPVIYEAPMSLDWTRPETWRIANPSIPNTITETELSKLCNEAKNSPMKSAEFKMFHLGWWLHSATAWLSREVWMKHTYEYNEASFLNRECYAGIDLAKRHDLACYVLIFPIEDKFYLLPRFFTPRELMSQKERTDHAPYHSWAQQGFITPTEGDVIDYGAIHEAIRIDRKKFNIKEVGYDKAMAEYFVNQQLRVADGMNCIEVSQSIMSMTAPTTQFEKLLIEGKIKHPNNPVLNWCAGNATLREDQNGNITVRKKSDTARCDGIVASIIGLSRAMIAVNGDWLLYL